MFGAADGLLGAAQYSTVQYSTVQYSLMFGAADGLLGPAALQLLNISLGANLSIIKVVKCKYRII